MEGVGSVCERVRECVRERVIKPHCAAKEPPPHPPLTTHHHRTAQSYNELATLMSVTGALGASSSGSSVRTVLDACVCAFPACLACRAPFLAPLDVRVAVAFPLLPLPGLPACLPLPLPAWWVLQGRTRSATCTAAARIGSLDTPPSCACWCRTLWGRPGRVSASSCSCSLAR